MLLARAEAHEQRGRQHVGRHGFLDRRLDGPAAFAAIVDVAGEDARAGRPWRARGREVEQPRGDDAAAPPDLGDVGEVEVEALVGRQFVRGAVLQDVEAFGDRPASCRIRCRYGSSSRSGRRPPGRRGCSRARRADRGSRDLPVRSIVPIPGASAEKIGSSRSTVVLVAADHQAVAALQAPHAARGADVEIVDALSRRAPWRGGRRLCNTCCRRR